LLFCSICLRFCSSILGLGVFGDGIFGDGIFGDGIFGDGIFGDGDFSGDKDLTDDAIAKGFAFILSNDFI
jgi:hypothetical protein